MSTYHSPRTIPTDVLAYSDKYCDEKYEYRHVIVPKEYSQ